MAPIFETKKIQMETLPEYLKSAREGLNYEIAAVSKITNISDKFLGNLEAGAYYKLPADVYVYGFLRKLAELYGTETAILIEQYKKERRIAEQLLKKTPVYKSYTDSKFVLTPKTMAIGALGALVIFVLGYLAVQVHAINQPPKIRIDSPADNAHITSSSLLIQGHTDAGANISMNDQQIPVDSDGNFNQTVSISPGEKVLTFVARNNFGKQSTKQIAIVGDFQVNQGSTPNGASGRSVQSTAVSLVVNVGPNSTWLQVAIDNNPSQTETFIAGSSKTYAANSKIVLSTGDGGSTSVKLNGKDLGKLGRDGEVVRDIPFSADSVNSK